MNHVKHRIFYDGKRKRQQPNFFQPNYAVRGGCFGEEAVGQTRVLGRQATMSNPVGIPIPGPCLHLTPEGLWAKGLRYTLFPGRQPS